MYMNVCVYRIMFTARSMKHLTDLFEKKTIFFAVDASSYPRKLFFIHFFFLLNKFISINFLDNIMPAKYSENRIMKTKKQFEKEKP